MASRSAEFYRRNRRSARKKQAYDAKLNAKPEQIRKRVEANRARRRARKRGKDVRGLDASHTKNGIVFKPTSQNRGSRSDSAGDRRARGGGSRG